MSNSKSKKTLLILSQVYPPDPTSVGQHIADAAAAMVARGFNVLVITSARGYDDPSIKYQSRQTVDGVEIRRLALSSFGKKSILLRLLGQSLFLIQCVMYGLFTRPLDCLMVSTSPPMCSVAAIIIGTLRRIKIKYWVMDLNPDQIISLGIVTEKSLPARVFNWFNRRILKRADDIVTLDRFMGERILRKRDVKSKMTILPPWPHDDHLELVAHEDNPFRKEHELNGRFVIMYSGNHGYCTPVTTILQAALKLQSEPRLLFMFIGGGVGKKVVNDLIEKHKPNNIVSLPYQPLSQIKYSLSAADVHLVSIGDEAVGVVHPCKVYGAMAVARPILLLGPEPCHVSDIVLDSDIGWQISHDDIDGAVKTLKEISATSPQQLQTMGMHARELITSKFSKQALCGKFCDIIERDVP